jgi:7-cyano-7-deazaguanine synthase
MSNPLQSDKHETVAVLVSGGLDSAVLVASEAQRHDVQPIYISCGLPWERVEQAFLTRFLAAYRAPHALLPLVQLELPLGDVYPQTHWAIRGTPPAYDTADEDVYLVGRNITLLTKAGIYCAFARLERIAMGQLQGNPFPDATPEFFAAMAHALSLGLDHRLEISFPFLSRDKIDVIRLGAALYVPFELTVSCMNPTDSGHCGACSKCRERRDAFIASGIEDRVSYDTLPAR